MAKKRYRWPKSVPILEPDDFCIGSLHEGNGKDRCCMLGWAAVVFARLPYEEIEPEAYRRGTVPEQVVAAINDTAPGVFDGDSIDKIHRCNDRMGRNRDGKKILADWWKRAVAELGYTEIVDV